MSKALPIKETETEIKNVLATEVKKVNPVFKKAALLLVGGILLGSVSTNRIDDFFATHQVNYESPVVFQSPILIKQKPYQPLVETIVIKETPIATPTATPEATLAPAIKK